MSRFLSDRLRLARKRGTIKRIVVNRHNIRTNKKHGTNLPVMSVHTSKGPIPCNDVVILGTSRLHYNTDKPLNCGATVWIQTTARVKVK